MSYAFFDGPWENSRVPTIIRDDPEGGDPHILATLSRIHNPQALHQLCYEANSAPYLLEALQRLSALTPAAANAFDATDLHATVKAIADSAIAKVAAEETA